MITWRDLRQQREGQASPSSGSAAPPPRAPVVGEHLRPGARASWHSPLFGDVHGLVALPPEKGMVCLCDHSVTGDTVFIPLEWVTSVEEPLDGKKET